jgi:hypothetical protein
VTLKTALAAVAIAALAAAWMLRFDLKIDAGGQGIAPSGYALDRWTGSIYFIAPRYWRKLEPETREEPVRWQDFTPVPPGRRLHDLDAK